MRAPSTTSPTGVQQSWRWEMRCLQALHLIISGWRIWLHKCGFFLHVQSNILVSLKGFWTVDRHPLSFSQRSARHTCSHTHTIWQKAKCGLRRNQPAGHNTHENWLYYDLWSLFVRFTAVRGTHAWDCLQGCCQGQSNVLGFSIFLEACQKDSTPAGVPVRTSGSMNINRILTPPKQILRKILWWVEDFTYCPHTCSWTYLHISCVHEITLYDVNII